MQFLQGHQLTLALQSLATENTGLKLAIAYWSSNSLSLLGLNPGRPDLEIVCCLKAGKSDPNVISRFHSKARQNDKLHAKVMWSQHRAIVSSANASSNGLPEEEQFAPGLIEADIQVDDPRELTKIRRWFDQLYAWVSRTAAGDPTAITAGLRATNSLASAGNFATCPSAKRKVKATLAPSNIAAITHPAAKGPEDVLPRGGGERSPPNSPRMSF